MLIMQVNEEMNIGEQVVHVGESEFNIVTVLVAIFTNAHIIYHNY